MQLNDNKAGMGNLNKEQINDMIRDASGERFKAHATVKQRKLQEKIDQQQKIIARLTEAQLKQGEREMNALIESMEHERDLSRWIVHVDMDCYYAACEMRDDVRLRDVPMAVGGASMLVSRLTAHHHIARACIAQSTSNYAARKFGVRAGMPGFIAKKLCPQLAIVPCNFDKYTKVAEHIREIFADYDPQYAACSLDEAYLDITECLHARTNAVEPARFQRRRYGGKCECWLPRVPSDVSSTVRQCDDQCTKCNSCRTVYIDEVTFENTVESVTNEIRFRIEQRTGLTASAGIAVNGLLAKICSDMNKPNGQYFLPADATLIKTFMHDLPLRKIGGVGAVSEACLRAADICTGGDVLTRRALLPHVYGVSTTHFLVRAALGIGHSFVHAERKRKSISTERSFSAISDCTQMIDMCQSLCRMLADDVASRGLMGRTVTLKIKTVDFEVRTRAHSSVDASIHTYDQLCRIAENLIRQELIEWPALSVRLLGVRLSNFADANEQSTPTPIQTISNYLQDGRDKEVIPDVPTTSKQSTTELSPEPVVAAVKVDEPCSSTSNKTIVFNFVCPLCALRLPAAVSEQRANEHVDACLNRRAIAQILADDDKQHVQLSITDEHHTTANDRNKAPKDVKRTLTVQRNKSDRTIDSFFKKSRV